MPTLQERLQNEYQIELFEEIGRGAEGICYRANHERTGRCAIKIYHARVDNKEELTKNIQREVEAAKMFRGSSLVLPLLDHYLVESAFVTRWELADRSLQDVIDQSPAGIEKRTCDKWFSNIALALDFIHAADGDWVHADVKPSNMLLLGKSAVLCDFGVAYRRSGLTTTIGTHGRLGTRAYMPLSECTGRPTRFSDLYAFILSYVYMRQGRHPLGETENEIISNQIKGAYDLQGLTPDERTLVENGLGDGIKTSLSDWFSRIEQANHRNESAEDGEREDVGDKAAIQSHSTLADVQEIGRCPDVRSNSADSSALVTSKKDSSITDAVVLSVCGLIFLFILIAPFMRTQRKSGVPDNVVLPIKDNGIAPSTALEVLPRQPSNDHYAENEDIRQFEVPGVKQEAESNSAHPVNGGPNTAANTVEQNKNDTEIGPSTAAIPEKTSPQDLDSKSKLGPSTSDPSKDSIQAETNGENDKNFEGHLTGNSASEPVFKSVDFQRIEEGIGLVIEIWKVEEITPDLARSLQSWNLNVNSEKTIGEEFAHAVRLDLESAEILSKCSHPLSFPALKDLQPEIAKRLMQHKYELSLNGITSLSSELAETLSKYQGRILRLDGIIEFADATKVRSLTKNSTFSLSLNGLRSYSIEEAVEFSQLNGDLYLEGVTSIEHRAARLLKPLGARLHPSKTLGAAMLE